MNATNPNRGLLKARAKRAVRAVGELQRWVSKSYRVEADRLNTARGVSLTAIATVVRRRHYLGHDVAYAPARILDDLHEYLASLPHYDATSRPDIQTEAALRAHKEQFSAAQQADTL